MATLRRFREQFIRERMAPLMLPAARKLIQDQKGHLVAIITATNRFLVEPIAAGFGVEHLMATEPEIRDDRFTGDIVAEPCMREGKIAHLSRWLAARGRKMEDFAESWFYSDSINDLPLLERVTHPVAVDAGAQLADIAKRRGWRQLSLR
jgi:HAD superfamily hydrolase (TIGR01490 family)